MAKLLPLETVTLEDPSSHALVALAPSRGGIVTRFEVEGRPILYLDEATLADPAANVRGGVPVLFPSPGPLADGRFAQGGREGRMKQHGFARNLPWEVASREVSAVTLRLSSSEETRSLFPWDFVATFRYSLAGARLLIEQRVDNPGSEPLPFASGFHPYFHVPAGEKTRARIPTRATRVFDNVIKRERALEGPIDLSLPEVDLGLVDHGEPEATLHLPDGARVVVSASPEYRRWVVWTLAGRDFVCLEPWTAPANALNTGQDLLWIEKGASMDLQVEIALLPR